MEYTITLEDKDESDCIETIAAQNSLSAEQYITNIIRGWIQPQLRARYVQAAKVATIAELKVALEPIITKIVADEAKKAAGG